MLYPFNSFYNLHHALLLQVFLVENVCLTNALASGWRWRFGQSGRVALKPGETDIDRDENQCQESALTDPAGGKCCHSSNIT
jgi:hypothetical protein